MNDNLDYFFNLPLQEEEQEEDQNIDSFLSLSAQIPPNNEEIEEIPQSSEMLEDGLVSSNFLRERLPTIREFYLFLRDAENIYLPTWGTNCRRPRWASEKYLEGILTEKYFFLRKDEVRKPVPRLVAEKTRVELVSYLEKEVDKPLGFTTARCVPKKYVTKLLYSVNPEHELFKRVFEKRDRKIPQGALEKLMQLPVVKMKGTRIFADDENERKKKKLETVKRMREKELAMIEEQEKLIAAKKVKFSSLSQMSKELMLKEKRKEERRAKEKMMEHEEGVADMNVSEACWRNDTDDSSEDGDGGGYYSSE